MNVVSEIKEKNNAYYIWRQGVLRWGVPTAIVFSVTTLLSSLLSGGEYIWVGPLLSFMLFPAGGYLAGVITWEIERRRNKCAGR